MEPRKIPSIDSEVVVIRGRKIPIGTEGRIVKLGYDTKFKKSWAVIRTADGTEQLTSFSNLDWRKA